MSIHDKQINMSPGPNSPLSGREGRRRPWRTFLKTPEDFVGQNAILCVGYLPKEIQFSFVLKAKQKRS